VPTWRGQERSLAWQFWNGREEWGDEVMKVDGGELSNSDVSEANPTDWQSPSYIGIHLGQEAVVVVVDEWLDYLDGRGKGVNEIQR